VSRRVAITGVGLVTPLGVGTDETWSGLVEGRSAVGPIEAYDPSSLRTHIGAEVPEFVPKEYVPNRRSLRTMTRNDLLGTVGAVLAVRDSGLELTEDPQGRHALFTGSNKEISDPDSVADAAIAARDEDGKINTRRFGEEFPRGVRPLFFIEGLQGASLFYISEGFSLMGTNTYFAGSAEAGMTAVGRGYRAVKRGEADLAIAGGFDDPVSWWQMCKLDALGILTGANDKGPGACRPFDKGRDGTVMGEGSAFFVLEEMEAAKARGAHVYCEVTGFGSGSDVGHLVTPDADGGGVRAAAESALREAGVAADAIDYVAAHASATKVGDASEARGLAALFAGNGAAVSSVKGATAHLCAGAGALNAAVAALAIDRGALPPTANLETPDASCAGLDCIMGEAREAKVGAALAIARGFEGQNVALALGAV
jgi:3-oxoacyl-[acyl-carrier-protein] synthase II